MSAAGQGPGLVGKSLDPRRQEALRCRLYAAGLARHDLEGKQGIRSIAQRELGLNLVCVEKAYQKGRWGFLCLYRAGIHDS